MTAESGLDHMPGSERVSAPKLAPSVSTLYLGNTVSKPVFHCLLQDDDTSEFLPDVTALDAKIAEAEAAMSNAESATEKRRAKERKEDLMRLKRVEQLYVCYIPFLLSCNATDTVAVDVDRALFYQCFPVGYSFC